MNPAIINQGTSHTISLAFLTEDDAPLVPDTVTYRIDCLTTGAVMQEPTAKSPASVIDLHLDDAIAAINDPQNPFERRRVLVVATYGDDALKGAAHYTVKNLEWGPPA